MTQTPTQETSNASTQQGCSDWLTPDTQETFETKSREAEANELLATLDRLLCNK